jgi:hydroxymethylpyrimidine/phosphomethylpyrimidine kinase
MTLHQVLCVGVSDSSAGTGIQADIKTIQAFGSYAATVIAAVSVQNTHNVYDVFPIPPEVVRHQLQAVIDDLKPTVIKTGMLGDEGIINVVGDFLDQQRNRDIKVVIDPVMTSRIGKVLLDKAASDALKRRLMIHADVITPNLREARDLTGLAIHDIDDMKHAADMLKTLGAGTVIVKGGGLEVDKIFNVLADDDGIQVYEQPRTQSRATHGAGTTLSAAVAVGIAQGLPVRKAFENAQDFLGEAIRTAEIIGGGYGPVNHNCRIKKS